MPVVVRYGAADTLVAAAHGRWLATHLPTAVEELNTTGHLSRLKLSARSGNDGDRTFDRCSCLD